MGSSGPDATPAPKAALPESLVRHERAVTVGALSVLVVLAWIHTVAGAGLGMDAWAMTSVVLFPHAEGSGPAAGSWSAGDLLLVALMWWAMMVAMMTPAAAPAFLLYARVHRQAQAAGRLPGPAPTLAFAGGYLAAWLGFSLVATGVQYALESGGLLSAMGMGSRSRWLSAAVLLAAGLYQFSPLKGACLSACRSPAAFLGRYWRPGAGGAFSLGLRHGAYCVGCCWVLMALLFVGGVMNLAWIAVLTALVLAEKWLGPGRALARGAGVVLLAWGLATLWV